MANVLPEGWTGEQSVGQRLETRFYSGYKPSGGECHRGRGRIEEKDVKDPSEQTGGGLVPCWVKNMTPKSICSGTQSSESESESSQKRVTTLCTQGQTVSMCSH